MNNASLIIAGSHSGAGKTTVALALMAALNRRGLTVQPFKVGPDFIDPGHHTAVCGRVSRNLDTWMLSEERVRQTFRSGSRGAAVSVVEGVMGLFDGKGPGDPRGSTAHLGRLLDLPVVLVVDAGGMAGSVAALVKGFAEFDPALRVVGVICNNVAGTRHYRYLEPAIRNHTGVVPLGWLPRRPDWRIPERHLGLVTAIDHDVSSFAEAWGAALAQTVNVDRLLDLCTTSANCTDDPVAIPWQQQAAPRLVPRRVALARDAAFCFYYPENIELLEQAGGAIVAFSPLDDAALPDGTVFLYLGGGYPELHAARLAANAPMQASIRRFQQQGGRIYAECGGLMYCCRELVDASRNIFPMLDLLPARTIMQDRLAALSYVRMRTSRPSPLGPEGTTARGHEFHYSRLEPCGPLTYAAELDPESGPPRPDGLVAQNLYAGYCHLHFGSNPDLAGALLGLDSTACASVQ